MIISNAMRRRAATESSPNRRSLLQRLRLQAVKDTCFLITAHIECVGRQISPEFKADELSAAILLQRMSKPGGSMCICSSCIFSLANEPFSRAAREQGTRLSAKSHCQNSRLGGIRRRTTRVQYLSLSRPFARTRNPSAVPNNVVHTVNGLVTSAAMSLLRR